MSSAAPLYDFSSDDWPASLELEDDDTVRPAPRRRVKLLTDVELDQIPEALPLIDGMLFQGQLIGVVGRFATYKTFLLLDWALCISLGLEWNGRRVRQGCVIYIVAEGASGIRKRVAAWKKYHQFPDSLPIFFLPSRLDIADPLHVDALLNEITAMGLERLQAVFVDTVARNFGGDENSAPDMGRFVIGCDRIRETTGASVILAHHNGWAAEKRSRGSIVLPSSLDTEIVLERDDVNVTLSNSKQKDAVEFAPITLQAVQIADSLILRTVVPTSAELTPNERTALSVVQTSEGLSATAWMQATGLAKGSFYNAQRRLLTLAYVRLVKSKYSATESGQQAAGTKYNAGTAEVQTSGQRR